MQLSKSALDTIVAEDNRSIPGREYFTLPEKVLQFGTGVLLRGLPDYFIDKANKQGLFNGRIVVVKSTATGSTDAFMKQDGLYTVCIKGIEQGVLKQESSINASISRVLSAATEWDKILECADDASIQIVISNTTEVGLEWVEESIAGHPPSSFPAKLLAILYRRYQHFQGDKSKGLVIIPTELIPDNGQKLQEVIARLSVFNKLGTDFIQWLNGSNYFCSSLVDCIVPGKLSPEKQEIAEAALGYQDELMIMSELYRLWAIETSDPAVRDTLSFSQADPGVVIAGDIQVFRELKLRLLNGAHTFCCGLAHLSGFTLVREAMLSDYFSVFMDRLMKKEIIPSITGEGISAEMANDFADKVLDRFRNPYIDHAWLNITLQYSSKMKMRNVPTLLRYYERMQTAPELMALGFAAHILFMRSQQDKDGKYRGLTGKSSYIINDDQAASYSGRWKMLTKEKLVHEILADVLLWGQDLSRLPGFERSVISYLDSLVVKGAAATIHSLLP